jgi:hypothetical protein
MVQAENNNYLTIWKNWLEVLPKDPKMTDLEAGMLLEEIYSTLDTNLRRQLIEVMLLVVLNQEFAHRIALLILKDKAEIEHRRKILGLYYTKLKEAKTWQDEYYLNALIDLLSYETTDEFTHIISEYLQKRPYKIDSPRPSDTLFRTHPDLFVKGWTRFFTELPYEKWHNHIYIQGLLSQPEQILALKIYMKLESPNTWKMLQKALLEGVDKFSLLSKEIREKDKSLLLS